MKKVELLEQLVQP